MGASWGHLAKISDRMSNSVRSEATQILLSGWYMAGGCCGISGSDALIQIFESLRVHKDSASAHDFLLKATRVLPLRHPLEDRDFELCDFRGCLTLGDVACILMQRVVVRCLLAEAKTRLWPVARSEQGAVHPCCWAISFATCTFPCVSCYSQQIACIHGGGCPCGPCCIHSSLTDVAWADFEVTLDGIPPLSVLAVACAWHQATALHKPPHLDEAVPRQLLHGGGDSVVRDKDWNWPDMHMCLGRPRARINGGRGGDAGIECEDNSRRLEYGTAVLPINGGRGGDAGMPLPAFMVVADGGIECEDNSRRLEYGTAVLPEKFSASGIRVRCGLQFPLMSEHSWLLLPLTCQWQARKKVPALDNKPEWIFDSLVGDEKRTILPGDIVTTAGDAKQLLRFEAIQPSHKDVVRIWKMDGSMVFSTRESMSNLTIACLKRELLQASGSKGAVWMIDLIVRASGLLAQDAELVSDLLKGVDPGGPLELELVMQSNAPVHGSWLQEEGGSWIPIFDTQGYPLLSPLADMGADLGTSADLFSQVHPNEHYRNAQVDPSRFFFSLDEFPQLAESAKKWKLLRDEGLRLWRDRRSLFVEYEGHPGWMACCLKLWGSDVSANLEAAPVAARLVQESSIEGLTTLCYSLLKPGCHIQPHEEHHGTTCIRAHLGLAIPTGCGLRVGPYAQTWSEGKWTIFNGTRSHEVLNAGYGDRIVLLVDFGGPKVDRICWPAWMQQAFCKASSDRLDPSTAEAMELHPRLSSPRAIGRRLVERSPR